MTTVGEAIRAASTAPPGSTLGECLLLLNAGSTTLVVTRELAASVGLANTAVAATTQGNDPLYGAMEQIDMAASVGLPTTPVQAVVADGQKLYATMVSRKDLAADTT